jgi:hypothetical protein
MIVGMFFDENASLMATKEEEYAEAEEELKSLLPDQRLLVQHDLQPYELQNNPLKLYLFDVGGLGAYVGHSWAFSLIREVVKRVEDMPDTLFVLWSSFTCSWYWDLVKEEFPELINAPNVLYRYDRASRLGEEVKGWQEKLKEWCK